LHRSDANRRTGGSGLNAVIADRAEPDFRDEHLRMKSRIINKLGNTPYVRKAIEEKADLSAFKQKPTARILFGVFLIGFSYVIGWPVIGALAVLAAYLQKPLVVIIGGPLAYGLSHLVFLAGMYLAGAKYTGIFLRWATRVVMEKLLEKHP
jgi:hypothetical protein